MENSVQNLENRENWNTIIWTSSSWEEVRKRTEESVLWYSLVNSSLYLEYFALQVIVNSYVFQSLFCFLEG